MKLDSQALTKGKASIEEALAPAVRRALVNSRDLVTSRQGSLVNTRVHSPKFTWTGDVSKIPERVRTDTERGATSLLSATTREVSGQYSIKTRRKSKAWKVGKPQYTQMTILQFIELIGSFRGKLQPAPPDVSVAKIRYKAHLQTMQTATIWPVQVRRNIDSKKLSKEVGESFSSNFAPHLRKRFSWLMQYADSDLQSTEKSGHYQFRAGSRVSFLFMKFPEITIETSIDWYEEIEFPVQLRDLEFLINANDFEEKYGVSWDAYVVEFGDEVATIQMLPFDVLQDIYFETLWGLISSRIHKETILDHGRDASTHARLLYIEQSRLTWLEERKQETLSSTLTLSPDSIRGLGIETKRGKWESGWSGAYMYTVLKPSQTKIARARLLPNARSFLAELKIRAEADELIRLMDQLSASVHDQWPFERFVKGHLGETLLDELFRRDPSGELFIRLFKSIKDVEAGTEFRRLVIGRAMASKYRDFPSVRDLVNYHNRRAREWMDNVYDVENKRVILNRFFGDKTIRYDDIFGDEVSTLLHEEFRFRPKSNFKEVWKEAFEEEAVALVGRIDQGKDSKGNAGGYTPEEFSAAVLKAAMNRLGITEDSIMQYFEKFTVQRSAQLLGLRKHVDDLGIETIYVKFQVVERDGGGGATIGGLRRIWHYVGEPQELEAGWFDIKLNKWVHEHVAPVFIKGAKVIVYIAGVAVAWEFHVLKGLASFAGGKTVVGVNIIISTIFNVIWGPGWKFESLMWGAIDGYLGALFFRGASALVGKALPISLSTTSVRGIINKYTIPWIAERLGIGIIGGGASGGAITFSRDVYAVVSGQGTWSSPADYAKTIGWGMLFGVGGEFAGAIVLEPFVKSIRPRSGIQTAAEVAELLVNAKVTSAQLREWSSKVIAEMSRRLGTLSRHPLTTIVEGFRIGYGNVTKNVRLSAYRRVLDLSKARLSSSAVDGLEKLLKNSGGAGGGKLMDDVLEQVVSQPSHASAFFEALNLLDDAAIDRLFQSGNLAALTKSPHILRFLNEEGIWNRILNYLSRSDSPEEALIALESYLQHHPGISIGQLRNLLDLGDNFSTDVSLPRELRPDWSPEMLTPSQKRELEVERFKRGKKKDEEFGERLALLREAGVAAEQEATLVRRLSEIADEFNLDDATIANDTLTHIIDWIQKEGKKSPAKPGEELKPWAKVDIGRRATANDMVKKLLRGGGQLEGFVMDVILSENIQAIKAMRARIAEIKPDAVLAVEKGGVFLSDVLVHQDSALGAILHRVPKGPKSERIHFLEPQIRKLIKAGKRDFVVADIYMGGGFSNELMKMYKRILSEFPDSSFESLWLREKFGFERNTVGGPSLPPLSSSGAKFRETAWTVRWALGDDMNMVFDQGSRGPIRIFNREGKVVQEITLPVADPMTGMILNTPREVMIRLMRGVKFSK